MYFDIKDVYPIMFKALVNEKKHLNDKIRILNLICATVFIYNALKTSHS